MNQPPPALQRKRPPQAAQQSLYGPTVPDQRRDGFAPQGAIGGGGGDRRPWREDNNDFDYQHQEEGIRRAHAREPSGSGLEYNDAEYRRQVARPAVVTDEPVYANNELDILTGGSGRFPLPRNYPAPEFSRQQPEGRGFIAAEAQLWSGDATGDNGAGSRAGSQRLLDEEPKWSRQVPNDLQQQQRGAVARSQQVDREDHRNMGRGLASNEQLARQADRVASRASQDRRSEEPAPAQSVR